VKLCKGVGGSFSGRKQAITKSLASKFTALQHAGVNFLIVTAQSNLASNHSMQVTNMFVQICGRRLGYPHMKRKGKKDRTEVKGMTIDNFKMSLIC